MNLFSVSKLNIPSLNLSPSCLPFSIWTWGRLFNIHGVSFSFTALNKNLNCVLAFFCAIFLWSCNYSSCCHFEISLLPITCSVIPTVGYNTSSSWCNFLQKRSLLLAWKERMMLMHPQLARFQHAPLLFHKTVVQQLCLCAVVCSCLNAEACI